MTSAEFIDFNCLPTGALIDVQTRNTHYQIECLGGNSIIISGHPDYCPQPVRGQIQGSSDKKGSLEPSLIGRGMYMRFLLEDYRPVTTSRVVSLRVDRSAVPAPAPAVTSVVQ